MDVGPTILNSFPNLTIYKEGICSADRWKLEAMKIVIEHTALLDSLCYAFTHSVLEASIPKERFGGALRIRCPCCPHFGTLLIQRKVVELSYFSRLTPKG
jgi:hypothetical protein